MRGETVFYDEDLAYVHDLGFTDMARNAARTVLQLLKPQKIKNGLVVDLGCGSGVFAERITCAGYDVLGIDVSEAMLRLARKRASRARFTRGSLFQEKLPNCMAVCAVGESVNYLVGRESTTSLEEFFRCVHPVLNPGGVFVFDIAEYGGGGKPWLLHSEDWAILVDKREDIRRRLLIRRMTTFRRVGRLYRKSEEVHRQRLYPLARIVKNLEATGFRVARLHGYGGKEFMPGHAGFVARKAK